MEFLETIINGLPVGHVDGFGRGVAHGFSTRLGGVSEGIFESLNLGLSRGDAPERVEENLRLFCAAVGVERENLVYAHQVHGDTALTVGRDDLGAPPLPEADALITNTPGLALTVFTADCLPILLYDPVIPAVAAIHAGWRGTALGIVERTVEKLASEYGSNPKDIRAALGPGISGCCFETREDVPNAMLASLGSAALPYIKDKVDGHFLVDLKGLNRLRLERAGLEPAHIAASPACTLCNPARYWSHRATNGHRGSMAAVIALLQ